MRITLSPRLSWFLSTLVWGSLLALGVVLLIQHVLAVSQGPTDFCQDYFTARRLLQGKPVYVPFHCWAGYVAIPTTVEYPAHPPPTVLLFVPFGLLPSVAAATLWGLCSLAAYLLTGTLLLKKLGWYSLRGLALFVAGSMLWEPMTVSETVQNLWEMLTLLLVAAWILEGKGREGWAGVLLGLAGLIKLWPVALLLGGLLRQQRRLALAGALTFTVGMLVSLFVLGIGDFAAYLGPVQADERYWVPDVVNVSVEGVVSRMLYGYAVIHLPPLLLGLPLNLAILISEAVAGLLIAATVVFLWWQRQKKPGAVQQLLNNGLLVTVLLLVFPLSWRWGLITLLFPCATTILALRQLPKQPLWVIFFLWMGLAPLLLRQSWIMAVASWLQQWSTWAEVWWFSLPTIGLLLFAAMQAYLLWQARAVDRLSAAETIQSRQAQDIERSLAQ